MDLPKPRQLLSITPNIFKQNVQVPDEAQDDSQLIDAQSDTSDADRELQKRMDKDRFIKYRQEKKAQKQAAIAQQRRLQSLTKKKKRRKNTGGGLEIPTIQLGGNLGFLANIIDKLKNEDNKATAAEQLSYKALHKRIVELHPTDPETFQKLSVGDSVSVSRYALKMVDAIGCLFLFSLIKEIKKWFNSLFGKKQKALFHKPETMKDVPDSDSDSEANDTFKGLSTAAIHLGEGSLMYLQMMKTLAVLFLILTIVNVPIYMLYSSTTPDHPDYLSDLEAAFKYFSIGNIGKGDHVCGFSSIDYDNSAKVFAQLEVPKELNDETGLMEPLYNSTLERPIKSIHDVALNDTLREITLSCEEIANSYIESLEEFGFMYLIDYQQDDFADANLTCRQIEEPYRKIEGYNYTEEQETTRLFHYQQMALEPLQVHNETKYNIDEDCNKDTLFINNTAKEDFMQFFNDNCHQKKSCVFDPENFKINKKVVTPKVVEEEPKNKNPENIHDTKKGSEKEEEVVVEKTLKLSEMISGKCYNRIYNRKITSVEFIIEASCVADFVKMPFVEDVPPVHKLHVGTLAVVADILSILIVYYVFGKLKDFNTEYQDIMDNNIIKMSKFAIRINEVKLDKTMQDPRLLKMKIWLHFTKLLNDHKNVDNEMEVADVQLANANAPRFFLLLKMSQLQAEFNSLGQKIQSGMISHHQTADYNNQMTKLREKIGRFKEKYDEILKKESDISKPVLQVSKHAYVEEIDYVWVVFRNNETPNLVYKLYEQEHPVSVLFRKLFCIKNDKESHSKLEDSEVILETQELEPDQILWENLRYTQKDQRVRKIIVFLVSILMAVLSIVSTLYFEGVEIQNEKYDVDCKGVNTGVEYVYNKQEQYMLQKKIQLGKDDIPTQLSPPMMCFCKDQTAGGIQFWLATSEVFQKHSPQGHDGEPVFNFCQGYVLLMINKQCALLVQKFTMVILNAVIAKVFGTLGELQMMHTTIEQTLSSFLYIVILEYFNMCVIILLQTFDQTGTAAKIMMQDPEDATIYQGFNANWYHLEGNKLCFAILMSSLISNFTEIKQLTQVSVTRFLDRGKKLNVKMDLEDDGDDEVNTKLPTQEQLEDLYTGQKFNGEESFSRMISIMMVCLTYSSGMPAMYFVGFIFFSITFFVNKVMLITYFQKTTTLSRVTPNYSLKFLNVAIFIHMVFGCIMFTNPSLFHTKEKPNDNFPKKFPWFNVPPEDQIEFETPFWRLFYGRTKYFHQQLYIVFFGCAIVLFIGGKFIKGLLILILLQIKALVIYLWTTITRTCSKIVSNLKSCFWSTGRKLCPSLIEKLEKKLKEIEVDKQLLEQRKAIIVEIDKHWHLYDRDRSGSLDKEEGRQFVKDLLLEVQKEKAYGDQIYDNLFEEYKCPKQGDIEKMPLGQLVQRMLKIYFFSPMRHFERLKLEREANQKQVAPVEPKDAKKIEQPSNSEEVQLIANSINFSKMNIELKNLQPPSKTDFLKAAQEKEEKLEEKPDSSRQINIFPSQQSEQQATAMQQESKLIVMLPEPQSVLNKVQPFNSVPLQNEDDFEDEYDDSSSGQHTRRYTQLGNIYEESKIKKIKSKKEKDAAILKDALKLDLGNIKTIDGPTSDHNQFEGGGQTAEGQNLLKNLKTNIKAGFDQGQSGIVELELVSMEEKLHKERVMAKFKKLTLHPNLSNNIFMELNIKNLQQMYEKSIKEENDINYFFNIRSPADALIVLTPPLNRRVKKQELRIIFEELCFTAKLQYGDVMDFLAAMRKRVEDIEKAIDHHFNMIKDTIYNSKFEAIMRQSRKYDKEDDKNKKSSNNSGYSANVKKKPKDQSSRASIRGTGRDSNRSQNSATSSQRNVQEELQSELQMQYQKNLIREKLQQDPELQFDNPNIFTYQKKLEMLSSFEEDLLKNDKTKKENRKGLQTICRMTGSISQSFFMLDQPNFTVSRDIFYGIQVAGEFEKEDDVDGQQNRAPKDMLQQKYNQNIGNNDVIYEQAGEQESLESQRAFDMRKQQKIKSRQQSHIQVSGENLSTTQRYK